MDLIKQLIEMVLHLDKHLGELVNYFGLWTYFILFIIIFCETGLVITPFLPGDSLLFAIGALSASNQFNVVAIAIVLTIAAIIGDTVNYHIGKYIGPKVFHKDNVRFLNKKHLIKTHEFYERHGGKTIIIARFMPIIRTFAPFVAGMGSMSYARFIVYNVVGGVLWVMLLVFAGYFFGNIPIVKKNFTLVIMAIIFISILPGIIAYWNERMSSKKAARAKAVSEQTPEVDN
ncbi:MAG: DedA family protein [Victivallaceae bacterium]|jgi:membrane-associated protein